jgi:hypothetical protein
MNWEKTEDNIINFSQNQYYKYAVLWWIERKPRITLLTSLKTNIINTQCFDELRENHKYVVMNIPNFSKNQYYKYAVL